MTEVCTTRWMTTSPTSTKWSCRSSWWCPLLCNDSRENSVNLVKLSDVSLPTYHGVGAIRRQPTNEPAMVFQTLSVRAGHICRRARIWLVKAGWICRRARIWWSMTLNDWRCGNRLKTCHSGLLQRFWCFAIMRQRCSWYQLWWEAGGTWHAWSIE